MGQDVQKKSNSTSPISKRSAQFEKKIQNIDLTPNQFASTNCPFFPNLEHCALKEWSLNGRDVDFFQLLFLSHINLKRFLKRTKKKIYFSETNYHSKIVYKSLRQCFWDSFIGNFVPEYLFE